MAVNPTTVYLIRHGHVDLPVGPTGEPTIYGPDAEISARGKDQMRDLGQNLNRQGVQLNVIYTSPLPRAMRSAEILEQELPKRVPIVRIEDLRAKLYPSWVGKPVRELEETGGVLVSREGDETDQEAGDRFCSAVRERVARNRGRTVAFVTHGEEIAEYMRRNSIFVKIPDNGEGFHLTVSPEGEILDYEQIRGESSARGVEIR